MVNYIEKEEKVIEKIVKTIEKLDTDLITIDDLNDDKGKKHHFKKWIEEKKAMHEIKHLLHEIGKYDKYDEKELEKIEKLEKEFDVM